MLSFQVTKPLKNILNDSQINLFLSDVLTKSDEEITKSIISQDTDEKQLFYSLIQKTAASLKEKNLLQNISPENFQILLKKALLIQQLLFIFLFYLLFFFLFYIGRFMLSFSGAFFNLSLDKKIGARILSLPFCFILTIYICGLMFNTLFSPFLLLLIAVLLSLLLAIYLKKH